MSKSKIYAVAVGRKVGIFNNWEECKESIVGYPGAKYKSFSQFAEDLAKQWIINNCVGEAND